ncbi:hypothetical protein PTSG_07001 [Salpingoeca rosetta]|uniref:Uncharacterized protein n=1 Tax=Salpingoeca rosetta (strain ATCC 50818 / BSB-021) TaxID=946362 RepID=F2UDR4_SALR5|nr:uncharacterized protein PTSG_07001 [Salpingoeca rosetta]EGD74764.1 hypothetical protein PTSG_07001 [Salpingoeca rosetta]|eukprot:XP_004992409.1 hypothetical protein PTSG_07001 [Salpingoeca rosetta]
MARCLHITSLAQRALQNRSTAKHHVVLRRWLQQRVLHQQGQSQPSHTSRWSKWQQGTRQRLSTTRQQRQHGTDKHGTHPSSSGASSPSSSAAPGEAAGGQTVTQAASARVTEAARHTYMRYRSLEEQLRWHGINMLAVLIAIVIGSAIVAVVLYFNREPLRENLSSEISSAAKRSLSNEEVVAKANEVTRDMVYTVLTDPQTVQYASQFLSELFAKPETRAATAKLLVQVMKDEECLGQTQLFFRRVVDWLSKDKQTQESLTKLILYILARDDTRRAVARMLQSVLQDSATRKQAGELTVSVLQMDNVKHQTGVLATDASHRVLDNDSVREHTVQFFKDTFANQSLQQEAGSAIWGAVKYSMTPSILGYVLFPQPKVSLPADEQPSPATKGRLMQQRQRQEQQQQQEE